MTINTISPATFTTSILIGDPALTPNAGHDSIPLMTTVGGIPVSAALELQSIDSALLLSRMTTAQMNAIPTPTNGMLIYNTTANQMYSYTAGVWIAVAGGGTGNVIGPGVSVAGDIAIFADTTGKLLADSGIHVANGALLMNSLREFSLKSPKFLSLVDDPIIPMIADPIGIELSNITYLQFNAVQDVGLIFVGTLMPVEFISNDFGPGSQVCSLFTGDLPSSSTTPSALVELQSTTGAFLISRMTTAERDALTAPAAGMMIFNTTPIPGQFNFYDGTTWITFSTGSGVPPVTMDFQILSSGTGTPIWYSTYIDTGNPLFNLSIGTNAGNSSITGSYNTLIGDKAGLSVTSGSFNSAFGGGSGNAITTGSQNSSHGYNALHTITTGARNSAFGYNALTAQTTSTSDNSAFGNVAGAAITTGNYNSIFGSLALSTETTGTRNNAFGYNTLSTQNGATDNCAFGSNTATAITTGSLNCAFGNAALTAETTGASNAMFGTSSGALQNGGTANSSFGVDSSHFNVTGTKNSAFGASALNKNLGSENCAFGYESLLNQLSLSRTSAFGYQSGLGITTGGQNSIFGYQALSAETTGANNSAFGYTALTSQTTSSGNAAFGTSAGASQAAYTNCTFLGFNADASVNSLTNATAIGYNASVGQSNSLILGNGANVGIGTGTPNTSSILELSSTTGALLLPRMTDAQRNALTPAAGMVIYDTSSSEMQFYNGALWKNTGAGASSTWIDQNTGSVTLAPGLSYMINNGAGLVTLTLPAAPALGDTYEIAGYSSGGWKVAQIALQNMQFGSTSTTPGITGYAASANQYDRILITYAANNTFVCAVLQSTGGITIN